MLCWRWLCFICPVLWRLRSTVLLFCTMDLLRPWRSAILTAVWWCTCLRWCLLPISLVSMLSVVCSLELSALVRRCVFWDPSTLLRTRTIFRSSLSSVLSLWWVVLWSRWLIFLVVIPVVWWEWISTFWSRLLWLTVRLLWPSRWWSSLCLLSCVWLWSPRILEICLVW